MKDILPGRGRRAGVVTLALALVTSVTGLAGLAGCGSGGGSTTSAAASTLYFLAFTWKWSPCTKTGPRYPSRSAAARITATYSEGRCSV